MDEIYGGVETGGSWCKCALGTGPDDIRAQEVFPTTSPPETLERLVDFFTSHPTPAAIGIGSFGPVDVDRDSPTWGYVTTTPKPGWQHTPVASVLRERLGIPIAFDTDVNAAAVGEHRWGAGRGLTSLCYLTVGTGIGAGLVFGGRPGTAWSTQRWGTCACPMTRTRTSSRGSVRCTTTAGRASRRVAR